MKYRSLLLSIILISLSFPLCGQEILNFHMFLPNHKGALEISLPGFEVSQIGLHPDGDEYKITAKNPNGMYLTAFVDVAPRKGSNSAARDDSLAGLKASKKFKMDDIKLSETKNFAVTEYIVHEYQGEKIEQKSYHVYFGGDDIWADVHMSKVDYKPEDKKLFDEVLLTLKFLPEYQPVTADWHFIAAMFYMSKDYKNSAIYYQKVLDLEKQKPTLSTKMTRVVIDQLGMSYGISGDIDRSRQVFEYGISKDPGYPLFYYNLACGYGEQGNKDKVIEYLKEAFERKANMIKGESMPDPMTDDSFSKFVKDKDFIDAVKAMKK